MVDIFFPYKSRSLHKYIVQTVLIQQSGLIADQLYITSRGARVSSGEKRLNYSCYNNKFVACQSCWNDIRTRKLGKLQLNSPC